MHLRIIEALNSIKSVLKTAFFNLFDLLLSGLVLAAPFVGFIGSFIFLSLSLLPGDGCFYVGKLKHSRSFDCFAALTLLCQLLSCKLGFHLPVYQDTLYPLLMKLVDCPKLRLPKLVFHHLGVFSLPFVLLDDLFLCRLIESIHSG